MRRLALCLGTILLIVGSFTVGSARLAEMAADANPILRGDVNEDGQITALDALAILSHTVGKALPDDYTIFPNGDNNGDGEITALDALIGLSHTVGKDVSQFPIGTPMGPRAAFLTISPDSGVVMVGSTLSFEATPRDSSNAALTGVAVSWSSSDTAVAKVDGEGVVTGVAIGNVTITATVDALTASVPVRVVQATGTPSISISPLTATLLQGDTLRVVAVVLDGAGNPIAGRSISWSSSDSTRAVVSAAGDVVGVGLGEVDIVATSGELSGTARISVVATASKVNRTWTGALSTDWGTAGNWQPEGVPVATDTLLVPANATRQPELNATGRAAGIVIERGARLDIRSHELQVSGRVDVDGEIVGSGRLYVTGVNAGTSFVRGTLPSTRTVGHTVVVGAIDIAGSLTLDANSILDVNRHRVDVSGNMRIEGTLVMQDAQGRLDVRGSATFFTDEPIGTGNLTAGTLLVGGDFTAEVPPGVSASPFTAPGRHLLVLDGSAAQTVTTKGVSIVEIQELRVANRAGGVVFDASRPELRFRVKGDFSDVTGASISGHGRVNVLGDFTTSAGGSVTLTNLAVRRVLGAAGTFSPDTFTLIGVQNIPAAPNYAYRNVVVAGTARFIGDAQLSGGLTIGCITTLSDCGEPRPGLDLAGRKVSVGGSMRQSAMHPTAELIMKDAAGAISVRGSVDVPLGAGGWTGFFVSDTAWTAGALRVGGHLFLRGSGSELAGASGTHSVTLDGPQLQALRATHGFRFQALSLADSIGAVMNDSLENRNLVRVRGDFNIFTAAELSGTGRLEVAGNVETATGSAVTVTAIRMGSVLRSSGAFAPDTAQFASQIAQTIPDGLSFRNIRVSGNASFGGDMHLEGSLIVEEEGSLNLSDRKITVAGDLAVAGVLRMQRVESMLTVAGSASFTRSDDPNSEAYVTAGVLRVAGAISGSRPGGFHPSTTHTVILTGTTDRAASGWFQNLQVVDGGKVTFPASTTTSIQGTFTTGEETALTVDGEVRVAGTLDAKGALAMGGRPQGRITLLQGYRDAPGSNITVGNLVVRGELAASGTLAPARLVLLGGDVKSSVATIGGAVEVRGPVRLLQGLTIEGSLAIGCDSLAVAEVECGAENAPAFELNGNEVTLNGSLLHTFGRLLMTRPADVLAVRDSVRLGNLVTENTLSAGLLQVGGNLSSHAIDGREVELGGVSVVERAAVFATRNGSEYGPGTRVVLNGSQWQYVTTADTAGFRFSDLELLNTGDMLTNAGGILFQNRFGVTGTRHVVGGTLTVKSLVVQYNVHVEAEGDLALKADAMLRTNGVLRYHGRYSEEGMPVLPGEPRLARLASIRWITQPTDRVAGVPFDPVLRLELLDSAGTRLAGSAPVRIQIGSGSRLDGPIRLVTADGEAAFTGLRVMTPTTGTTSIHANTHGSAGLLAAYTGGFSVAAAPASHIRFRRNDPNLPELVSPQSANTALQGPAYGWDTRLVVQVTDSVGNPVSHGGTVTVVPGPGSPDSVVYGTPSFSLQSGGAAFASDLRLQRNGIYTLIPTVEGLTGIATDTFRIIGGTASLEAPSVMVLHNGEDRPGVTEAAPPRPSRGPESGGEPSAVMSGAAGSGSPLTRTVGAAATATAGARRSAPPEREVSTDRS